MLFSVWVAIDIRLQEGNLRMKRIISGLVAVVLVTYGGTVAYLTHFDHAGGPVLAADSPTQHDSLALAAFNALHEARCDYCHSKNTDLPFYFSLPIASSLMQHDLEQGLRHFRIEPVFDAFNKGQPPAIEQLSRIEEVIRQNRMPPSLYLFLHWHAYLSKSQRQAILDWIDSLRRQYYATPGVAPQFAAEPVQPIPAMLPPIRQDVVALGKKLYYEKLLSGDNSVSCASCHSLNTAGVDGLVTSTGIGGQKGPINAPTVYNSVFNIVQFWNGRAKDLAEQAAGPVMNPVEMGSHDWNVVAGKLAANPDYVNAFAAVFPGRPIDKATITDAIAEFEKTLITPDSRFDQYLKGNVTVLNDQEKHGYALFKSVGCAGCHSGIGMGGGAMEQLGLEGDYFSARGGAVTSADEGRFTVTKDPLDQKRQKIPLLRNVALTGPWFHDGSVKTLEQAVRLMARYQTPQHDLSEQQVADITAFLKTLTGKYNGTPIDKLHLPE